MPDWNENELREVFRKAGHAPAPPTLHAAVMARVEAAGVHAVQPLITARQWTLTGLALASLILLLVVLDATVPGVWRTASASAIQLDLSLVSHWADHAGWAALAMGLILLLTVADRLLARMPLRSSHSAATPAD